MKTIEKAGPEHTQEILTLAMEKAEKYKTAFVLASSSGRCAKMAAELKVSTGFSQNIVVVTTAATAASHGINRLDDALRSALQQQGLLFVTAAHALSAAERAFSSRHHGISPLEIMAETLRTFGQGTKVCFECSVMALDAGVIPYSVPIVAAAGSGGGLDTAMLITPSYSSTILDTQIHEFFIKPWDPRRP